MSSRREAPRRRPRSQSRSFSSSSSSRSDSSSSSSSSSMDSRRGDTRSSSRASTSRVSTAVQRNRSKSPRRSRRDSRRHKSRSRSKSRKRHGHLLYERDERLKSPSGGRNDGISNSRRQSVHDEAKPTARIQPSASILKSILQRTTRSRDYMDHHERARAQQKLQEMDEDRKKSAHLQ